MKRSTVLLSTAGAVIVILSATILGMARGRLGTGRLKAVAHAAQSVNPTAIPFGVAAIVNGQAIPISQVSDIALRVQGESVLDQLIGDTLIHQEAKRRNMMATEAQIDARVERIRLMVRPHSLDDSLRARHMSMAQFRDEMQSGIEVRALLAGRLRPVKMVHVRDIFVNISPFAGMAANLHTAAQARRIMATVEHQLNAGVPFADVARHWGDQNIEGKDGGDLGIVTNFPDATANMIASGFSSQPAFLKACLSLKRGETAGVPIRTKYGLHLIQAISTGDAPLPSEVGLYAQTRDRAVEYQLTLLAPKYVDSLRRAGDVVVYLGSTKSGPADAAAIVNGQEIPTSRVTELALSSVGRNVVEKVIDEVLVDQEAAKRRVTVSEPQIDARIAAFCHRSRPRTLNDILKQGHMTTAEFREMQKAQIEAEEIVGQTVGPVRASHLRDIGILINRDPEMTVGHTVAEAKSMMEKIQARLNSGEKFEDLARRYSEDLGSKGTNGDLGIVTEKDAYEPAFLKVALALKSGQVTSQPVRTTSELHLLQAVSTSQDHPASEDRQYEQLEQNVRKRETQTRIPDFIRSLRSTNKVVDYLAST